MKNDRLFGLLYLLAERGSLTAPELAALLEVSVRTIYRDVETLAQAGVPIYALAGKGGGITLMEGYVVDHALFTAAEQDELLFSLQSLQAAGQNLRPLLSKLGALFRRQNADWITVDFSRWGHQQTDSVRFEQLKQAILERRFLRIRYSSSAGETSERIVKPLRLVFKDRSWYLQAYCTERVDYRIFRISRIRALELLAEQFEQEDDAPPPIEGGTSGMYEPLAVRIRFAPEIAFRVVDEFDATQITWQPDGGAIVEVEFASDGWIQGYLLGFGTQAELLEPAWLREQLAGEAKKMFEQYKS